MKRLVFLLFIIPFINVSIAQTDTVIIKKSTDKVIIGGQAYYVHIVKKGETLYSLSNAYNVTQKEIAKENPEIFKGCSIITKEEKELRERGWKIFKENFVKLWN